VKEAAVVVITGPVGSSSPRNNIQSRSNNRLRQRRPPPELVPRLVVFVDEFPLLLVKYYAVSFPGVSRKECDPAGEKMSEHSIEGQAPHMAPDSASNGNISTASQGQRNTGGDDPRLAAFA
jgi:hypothetical protein